MCREVARRSWLVVHGDGDDAAADLADVKDVALLVQRHGGRTRQAVREDGRRPGWIIEAQHQSRAAKEWPGRSMLEHEETGIMFDRKDIDGSFEAGDKWRIAAGRRVDLFHGRDPRREWEPAEKSHEKLILEDRDSRWHRLDERSTREARHPKKRVG